MPLPAIETEGPLDEFVKEILDNHDMLTPTNIQHLRIALPAERATAGTDFELFDLRSVVEQQMRSYKAAFSRGLSSESTLDHQRIQQMGVKLISVMDEFNDKIKAQERGKHVENAIIEVLDEIDDAVLKQKFMEKLAVSLSKQ